uniref:Uncharacterized protein n=1 Tax=Rhipicephalus zambeziensis TaxID=60191 RepID=A0A224Y977_9ACAR
MRQGPAKRSRCGLSRQTEEAERPAGSVGIYVKLPDTAENFHLPLTNQSHNGEQAAVKLANGIVIMTMYLAPDLSKGNIVKYIKKAMLHYERIQTQPFRTRRRL